MCVPFASIYTLPVFLARFEKIARIDSWQRRVQTGRMGRFAWTIVTGNTWLMAALWRVDSVVSTSLSYPNSINHNYKTIVEFDCLLSVSMWVFISDRGWGGGNSADWRVYRHKVQDCLHPKKLPSVESMQRTKSRRNSLLLPDCTNVLSL